jgi:hypothetical protein
MKTQASSIDMNRVDQLGRVYARLLNEHATDLPHDISERLRVARMQALSVRKREPIRVLAPQLLAAGGPDLGSLDEGMSLWRRTHCFAVWIGFYPYFPKRAAHQRVGLS